MHYLTHFQHYQNHRFVQVIISSVMVLHLIRVVGMDFLGTQCRPGKLFFERTAGADKTHVLGQRFGA